jgi:basic amino acid/polyamine antiporter, APA family
MERGLIRGLGLTATASLGIANIIGTGVFLKARVMTCNVGSPMVVLAVWLAAGLLVMAGALTYAELASMMPKAGGEYVFLREAYGRRLAFFYGWSYLVISRGGSISAQAVSTAIFFNIVTGGGMGRWRLAAASAAAIALMAVLNFAPVRNTGRIAVFLAVVKTITVLAVGAVAFSVARGNWGHFLLSGADGTCDGVAPAARGGLAGFGAAMIGALWGYNGWANATSLAGEIRDPQRNVVRAFAAAVLVVGALYLFANAGYFYALDPRTVAGVSIRSSVATEALSRMLGPAAAGIMAMAMMFSSLGALHTGIAATARVPYAMAADGTLFAGLSRLSARTHVPVRAVVLVAVWAATLATTGSYDRLTDWAIFALWLFHGLNAGAVIVLRRKRPDLQRPYKVWGYPVVPLVFVLVTTWLLLNTLLTAPLQTAAGLGLMLLGLIFYRRATSKTMSGSVS